LAADRWLLVTEALPTHQKFILIRVSGEEKFLMRWPYKSREFSHTRLTVADMV
jgi:hypothetical protein